jgi:FkbM family methyltransferase
LATLLRQNRPRSKVFEYALVAPGREAEAYLVIPSASGASAYVTFQAPASGQFERVKTATIDWVLEQAGVEQVDYLSLDVEKQELEVLRGFNLGKYRPKLILIEDHLHTLEKHRFLKAHGYRLVDRIGYNQWYIPENRSFPLRPRTGHLELFRKLYLSHPFRILKLWLKGRSRRVNRAVPAWSRNGSPPSAG